MKIFKSIIVVIIASFSILSAFSQIKSRIKVKGRTVNQLEAYGRVMYNGLLYFPIGKDSLEVKWDCNHSDSIIIPETITIDNKPYIVRCLRNSAFEQNSQLKYIELPPSISEISGACFWGCHSLSEIRMPGVKVIKGSAFFRTRFKRMIIPEGVTTIGNSAFLECSQLKYLELPSSLKSIGDNAFRTEHLDTVRVNFREPIPLPKNVFWLIRPNTSRRKIVLEVPRGSKEAFEVADGWKLFGNNIIEY